MDPSVRDSAAPNDREQNDDDIGAVMDRQVQQQHPIVSRAFSAPQELQANVYVESVEAQFLQGAQNFTISNSTFTSIHETRFESRGADYLPGFSSLHAQVSHKATFDSAERYAAGRCHPGTRQEIVAKIRKWVLEANPDSNIIWINGPAGIGKSSIAQTIAELLYNEHRSLYAGSFFFAGGNPGRDKGGYLFSSLAYQIGVNFPSVRTLVGEAMVRDRSLPMKTMEIQLRSLIVEPMLAAPQAIKDHTPTVIIDGLDECKGHSVQCKILSLIANALSTSKIPLRFIISSRPEYWIRDAFSADPLGSITQRTSPREGGSSDCDIEKFLVESFEDIMERRAKVMGKTNIPWPPTDAIHQLVHQASGQFIYPSTIIKFIDAPHRSPVKQLDIVLTPGPLRKEAFTDIDNLYRRILAVYPEQEVMKTVLAGILLGLPPRVIQVILGVDYADVCLVLDCLSSLVELSQNNERVVDDEELECVFGAPESIFGVIFSHRSIEEFLTDDARAGFSIDLDMHRAKIITNFFDIVIDSLGGVFAHEKYGDITAAKYYRVFQCVSRIIQGFPALVGKSKSQRRQSTTWTTSIMKLNLVLARFLTLELAPPDQLPHILKYIGCVESMRNAESWTSHCVIHIPSLRDNIKKANAKVVGRLISSRHFEVTPSSIVLLSQHLELRDISNVLDVPVPAIRQTLGCFTVDKFGPTLTPTLTPT